MGNIYRQIFRKCNDTKIMIVCLHCNSLRLHYREVLNLHDGHFKKIGHFKLLLKHFVAHQ